MTFEDAMKQSQSAEETDKAEMIEFLMLTHGESLDRAVQIAGNHPDEVRAMMAKAKAKENEEPLASE